MTNIIHYALDTLIVSPVFLGPLYLIIWSIRKYKSLTMDQIQDMNKKENLESFLLLMIFIIVLCFLNNYK